ncbi:MAG: chemotaxis protein CheW, partial [Candidatus Heimdallarchaeota archaeon]
MSKKSVPTISFDLTAKTSKKHIIFMIEEFQFGVPVEQISQVVKFEKVFSLPNTPDYVLGVMNLRGKIISLIHLAKRLGLSNSTEVKDLSQVLFVDLGFETVGMLIDKVVTLKNISQENIT